MTMATRIHHYQNKSVKPYLGGTVIAKDYYDGEPQFIPARGSILLVPCYSEDPCHEPFVNQCVLITRASYYLAHNDFPCVAFYIANDTDITDYYFKKEINWVPTIQHHTILCVPSELY